ncbi:actin, plasmodial isoform-like [Littorina saxatilis]|uniref:Uncharacterized protein n=1 Tax=Littorina saxatilis TaxID=31220 RepID=A0AAN9GJZ8_9CAEN
MAAASPNSDTGCESRSAAVIEFGSHTTRAGFAGKEHPQLIMPSVVGRPRTPEMQATGPENSGADNSEVKGSKSSKTGGESSSEKVKEVYAGDEAMSRRGVLRVKYPVQWGIVTNWDDLEVLWRDVFEKKLACDTEQTPLVLVEGDVGNPKMNREKATQVAFETFNVPAFYLARSPSLVLGATSRTTGLVVDIGGSVVRAVPVYEGHCLTHAAGSYPFGSRYCTDYLLKLLVEKGVALAPYGAKEAGEMIKKFAYIAQDFEQEKATFDVSQVKEYEFPDGQTIPLGPERFQCVEPLFKPNLFGFEVLGLAEHAVNTVERCDPDLRQTLLSNVVLAGGASSLPGLASRFQQEMERELGAQGDPDLRKLHVQVLAPPGGDLLAWKGASLLASSSSFLKMCISLDDYNEYGPTLVYRKCF